MHHLPWRFVFWVGFHFRRATFLLLTTNTMAIWFLLSVIQWSSTFWTNYTVLWQTFVLTWKITGNKLSNWLKLLIVGCMWGGRHSGLIGVATVREKSGQFASWKMIDLSVILKELPHDILSPVFFKPKNNGLLRKINTKGVILEQKGTRMAESGKDWNGLEMTIMQSLANFFKIHERWRT